LRVSRDNKFSGVSRVGRVSRPCRVSKLRRVSRASCVRKFTDVTMIAVTRAGRAEALRSEENMRQRENRR
jgi:hypothetical protein